MISAVGPFGQLVLHHGLAGAEGAGHRGHAALGQGEQGIDDPLAGDQQDIGGQLIAYRDGPPRTGQVCIRRTGTSPPFTDAMTAAVSSMV